MRTPDSALTAASDALAAVEADEWTEGTLGEVAARLRLLRSMIVFVKELESMAELHLIESMDTDHLEVDGVGRFTREETTTSTWADDGASERMRSDLAMAVARNVSVDVGTGEIDEIKQRVAMATMRAAYEAIPSFSSLKVAGRRRFGLRLDDYRTYGNGYRIIMEEAL